MRIALLLLLTVLNSSVTFANKNGDSLIRKVEDARDTSGFGTMLKLASELSASQPETGEKISLALYSKALAMGEEEMVSESLIRLANSLIEQSKYDSALLVLQTTRLDFKPYSSRSAFLLNIYTATAHYYLGEYAEAIPFLMENLKSEDLVNKPELYFKTLYRLGEIYRAANNLDPAEYFLKLARKQALHIKDSILLASAINRLGVVHYQNSEHKLAEEYLSLSLKMSISLDHSKLISMNLNDLGELYFTTGNFTQSLRSYEKAYDYSTNADIRINSLNNMARLHHKMGDYDLAAKKAAAGLQQAEDANILAHKLESLQILAESYSELDKYNLAINAYKDLLFFREAQFKKDKNKEILSLEARYQAKQKEEEIAELIEMEAGQRQSKMIFFSAFVIAMVILAIFIFLLGKIRRSNRRIYAQNLQLEQLNATRDKFFSIIAHDLRSPMIALHGVGSKLDYYIRKDKREKLLEMGGKIDLSISQLNHLLNNLLSWAVSQTGTVPHHPATLNSKILIEESLALYLPLAKLKNVTIDTTLEDSEVYADANALSTILRNIICNAIKFTPVGGRIIISNKCIGDHTEISISDEGEGMGDEKRRGLMMDQGKGRSTLGSQGERGFGLGLRISREFIARNKGELRINSSPGQGSTFTLSFPQDQAA